MSKIKGRVGRLEKAFLPRLDPEGMRLVALLLERQHLHERERLEDLLHGIGIGDLGFDLLAVLELPRPARAFEGQHGVVLSAVHIMVDPKPKRPVGGE